MVANDSPNTGREGTESGGISEGIRPAGHGRLRRLRPVLGYESLWAGQEWGVESLVELTEIAGHTDEIGPGGAIPNVFSRTLAPIAMAAPWLQRVSDGCALIVVGAGHDGTVTTPMGWTGRGRFAGSRD